MCRVFLVLLISLTMTACTKKVADLSEPKKTLQSYISKSFAINGVEDKRMLESFLTGEAKHRLKTWTDKEFRKAFIDSKRKFDKLTVKSEKKLTPAEVELTYELSYFDGLKQSEKAVTTLKKALITKVGQDWLIREVQNIKLLVEYKEELSLP